MSEQFKFRLYCCTESNYVDFWSYDDPPATCPNSYKHTIDKTKMYKLDERYVGRKNTVYINQEEEYTTQGRYKYECIKYNIGSNADQTIDYVFEYPINMLEVKIRTSELHRGDVVNCTVVPTPPIGYLTAPVSAGSSNFVVNNTVISYIKKGYHISLMSGSNLEDLDEIVIKNDSNNTLITKIATSNSYPPGTHVHMHIGFIKNLEFTEPDWYVIGDRKFSASYLPANTTLRMNYSNSNETPKELILHTQYLY